MDWPGGARTFERGVDGCGEVQVDAPGGAVDDLHGYVECGWRHSLYHRLGALPPLRLFVAQRHPAPSHKAWVTLGHVFWKEVAA